MKGNLSAIATLWCSSVPRGPKDQKNSRFRARLKISSEIEIFECATHRSPIFCGEIDTLRLKFSIGIENFDRDWKFRSGLNFFDRWALWVPLSTIQSEICLNPPFLWTFLTFPFKTRARGRKVIMNRRIQMRFANFRVNQPCLRLHWRERYWTISKRHCKSK